MQDECSYLQRAVPIFIANRLQRELRSLQKSVVRFLNTIMLKIDRAAQTDTITLSVGTASQKGACSGVLKTFHVLSLLAVLPIVR